MPRDEALTVTRGLRRSEAAVKHLQPLTEPKSTTLVHV